jgi:3-methylcrotonyl-CoA carboxylase alpha subunit
MKLFEKILIANRGEIAVRIIRSAKKLGIRTVSIFSPADENALHVKLADEAYALPDNDLAQSYLNMDLILDIALKCKAEAIHPGYGFLSENPDFVSRCEKRKIVFIGPKSDVIQLMGNKIEARQFAEKIGIPITKGVVGNSEELLERASEIDFPILLKAAAGGGGKGMRIIHRMEDLAGAIESTSREAKSYFGDESVYIEKFVENPRHIEVQVIGDNHGNVIHLFERECSIQRRYQKIIEESPASVLTDELRQRIAQSAVEITKAVKYNNAGTIEFLVDSKFNHYFLEMNTRVQVEHPVTEMVTGTDIVEEQILIAAGNPMRLKQSDIKQTGHAIECRIYAEDPENNFMPSPGKMYSYIEPTGQSIRIDTGIDHPTTIESIYDPMISKLIVHRADRDIARKRMISALKNYNIHGIKTNIAYLLEILEDDRFVENTISTKFCDETIDVITEQMKQEKQNVPREILLISFLLYNMNRKKLENPSNIWEKIGYWRELMSVKITLDEITYELHINDTDNLDYQIELSNKIHHAKLKSIDDQVIEVIIDGYYYTAFISCDLFGNTWLTYEGLVFNLKREDQLPAEFDLNSIGASSGEKSGIIKSQMPGKVVKVNVAEGDKVSEGDVIVIVESMKMENNLLAEIDGIVEAVNAETGEMVDSSKVLVKIKEDD